MEHSSREWRWKWEMRPHIVHCMYTVIILPVQTYGQTTWWTYVKPNPSLNTKACLHMENIEVDDQDRTLSRSVETVCDLERLGLNTHVWRFVQLKPGEDWTNTASLSGRKVGWLPSKRGCNSRSEVHFGEISTRRAKRWQRMWTGISTGAVRTLGATGSSYD